MSSLTPWKRHPSSSLYPQTLSSTSQCILIRPTCTCWQHRRVYRTYSLTREHIKCAFPLSTSLIFHLCESVFIQANTLSDMLAQDVIQSHGLISIHFLYLCNQWFISSQFNRSVSFPCMAVYLTFQALTKSLLLLLISYRRSSSNISGFNSEMCPDDQSVGLTLASGMTVQRLVHCFSAKTPLKCCLPSFIITKFPCIAAARWQICSYYKGVIVLWS